MNTNTNGKGDAPRQGQDHESYRIAWSKLFDRDTVDVTGYLPTTAWHEGHVATWNTRDEFLQVDDGQGREVDSWYGVDSEERVVYILQLNFPEPNEDDNDAE